MNERLTATEQQTGHVTPSMAQYIEIKAANPDCLLFYRMGDFYELFFDDAETASRALGIVLTKRGKHHGADIPMCGVPVSRSDEYLRRLIALGHRVAVCEQLEDPAEARKRGSKAVVHRDVVRLVTPGTITEDGLLDPSRANSLVALARRRNSDESWSFGVALMDISTGTFIVSACDLASLGAEIARLDPREIIVPDAMESDPLLRPIWRDSRAAMTPIAREGFDPTSAARRLTEYFGVATLDGFGAFSSVEIAAAALAISYVERTQKGQRPALRPPSRASASGVMQIDPATRLNLELMRTTGGERQGSLIGIIDRSVTASGGRLLAERLAGPLLDPDAINTRLDSVSWLVGEAVLRSDLRQILRSIPDLARSLARLALDRAGPRDILAIGAGLVSARRAGAMTLARTALPAELSGASSTLAAIPPELPEPILAALADEPPLSRHDGGFIRDGHDFELDEFRTLQTDARRFIAELQARYAQETGCRTLRIKHNNFIGYFIEVPQAVGEELTRDPWRDTFIHRQTMAGAMRFSTVELSGLESRIASAAGQALQREQQHFDALRAALLAEADRIRQVTDAIAVIDASAALAELAVELGWTRPVISADATFRIERGRHPVVEAALIRDGQSFVPNDAALSHGEANPVQPRLTLVTGPNMAGKSTFLRQNALIAILAQMGSHVPAASAEIGIVDRLFSRVGAADDLARGRSTFMVEMVETAAILNQAGPRALVILDEIGRGTATFDGLSIAWAVIEHLHDVNRCRTLFATHFHELTALSDRLDRVTNVTMRVSEWNGEVVFLHEMIAGAADRSYGIQVARLAGLPALATERAKAILSELEKGERERPVSAVIDDLPLFSALARQPVAMTPNIPAGPGPVEEALQALDPDEMTPREALEALYRLKRLSRP